MALAETLKAVAQRLRENAYANEQAISHGIVLRVLNDLGWDTYNTDTVWPEYSVQGRRVDFALCSPPKQPAVFLEVKQPDRVEGGDQQLFEYAFHLGVPMAILCDGKTWAFYLPAEQGSYEDRRVYKLDLLERSFEESAEKLTRYLDYQRTVSRQAIDDARSDYRDQSRRVLARRTIADAWKDLVEAEEPAFIERLADEVETKCGVEPEIDDVVAFLKTLRSVTAAVPPPPPRTSTPPRPAIPAIQPAAAFASGFELNGNFIPCRTAKEVMIGVLRELTNQDPTFPERCSRHPENRGHRRTYIARETRQLYPGRPDLEKQSYEFAPGWFVATNVSNQLKDKIIRMAAEVARISLNSQLRYSL